MNINKTKEFLNKLSNLCKEYSICVEIENLFIDSNIAGYAMYGTLFEEQLIGGSIMSYITKPTETTFQNNDMFTEFTIASD